MVEPAVRKQAARVALSNAFPRSLSLGLLAAGCYSNGLLIHGQLDPRIMVEGVWRVWSIRLEWSLSLKREEPRELVGGILVVSAKVVGGCGKLEQEEID